MTFRNELERSDLSSIDKLVEILYRNENCLFCKATGCKCPFDDIESDKSKSYPGKEKKHLESLEFTNQHIKILLRISFGMKIIAPILFHYVTINVIKLDMKIIYFWLN